MRCRESRRQIVILSIVFAVALIGGAIALGSTDAANSADRLLTDEQLVGQYATQSSGKVIVWLDVLPDRTTDGLVYLRPENFGEIARNGGKAIDVGFSPNGSLLWYLVETANEDMTHLLNVTGAISVQVAYEGGWPYWNRTWWSETRVDPYVDNYSRRISRMVPRAYIPVLIHYREESEGSRDILDSSGVATRVRLHLLSLGATDIQQGPAPFFKANLPGERLHRVLNEENITMVSHDSPGVLFTDSTWPATFIGRSPTPEDNSFPWPRIFLLVGSSATTLSSSIADSALRRRQRILVAVLTYLLLLSVLTIGVPDAEALNVSRQAVRADTAPNQGADVTVCVVDTGVDTRNPHLANAVVGGHDLTGGNFRDDTVGHGTHVAGIVASRSNTYRGIASQAGIYAVKFGTASDIIDGINHCVNVADQFNIRVITLSVGPAGYGYTDGTDAWSDAVDDAVEAGLVVTAASGNYQWPFPGHNQLASAFNIIAVGAIDDKDTIDIADDERACYSVYGTTPDGRKKPDVVAPGSRSSDCILGLHTGIWSTRSTVAPTWNYEDVDGDYGRMSGTSMATPHVAGQAAIILAAHPEWTPNFVKDAIRRTAEMTGNLNPDEVGYGVIDVTDSATTNVDGSLGWDGFDRATPWKLIDCPPLSCIYEKATYKVNKVYPGAIDLYNVRWQERVCDEYGCYITEDHKILYKLTTRNVWISGTRYSLSYEYTFSGPRVYSKGEGFERIKMVYVIGLSRIELRYKVAYDVIQPWLYFTSPSYVSFKMLSYYDFDIRGAGNDMIQNYATGSTYMTETKIGDVRLLVKDASTNLPHVDLRPYSTDSPMQWLLRYYCSASASNPDSCLDGQSIYKTDILTFYQAYYGSRKSAYPGPWLYIKKS